MFRFRVTTVEATLGLGLVLFACIACTVSVRVFQPGGDFGAALDFTELIGWALLYLVGLSWASFMVEHAACQIESRAKRAGGSFKRSPWNPLDPASRFYGVWPGLISFVVLTSVAAAAAAIVLLQPSAKKADPSELEKLASWVRHSLSGGSAGPAAFDHFVRFFNATILKKVAVSCGAFALLALATAVAQSRRLRQSLSVLAVYSIWFGLIYLLAHLRLGGGENEYILPAGGGSDSIKASSVKVTKVIRKKYVINPYSSIMFAAPPPIDKIDVKLLAETSNQYKAGQGEGELGDGEGDGGGFGGGKAGGKMRFIRLRHADKSWDKNFGIGGDANLLADYASRHPKSRDKVAKDSEAFDITGLRTFVAKASPPMVYVGGAGGFSPSADEKAVLKQYLIDKHGMILGDNLGGGGFHSSFIAVMNEITGVSPVEIPRDDPIHKKPYDLPLFPFVVAHARPVPLGWKIDGRWAVYYHPGALSDAWRDDRAGIKKEIAEMCYMLGHNILYYSHREYGRWLKSQQP